MSFIADDANFDPLTGGPEYESMAALGSLCGISDLETIIRANALAADLGLDSIETGAALGVAAEAGQMGWGDGERALELLDEIRRGTPLGRVLGNGAVATGKHFGIEHVPAVKGQAMAGYDPRAALAFWQRMEAGTQKRG